MENFSLYLIPILQIVWIDLLLSGDNAIIIAMACQSLPAKQRRIGMLIGSGVAILLRIIFAIFITYLLNVPFLKIVGGLLLLWIGVKLAIEGEEKNNHSIKSHPSLWRAVMTIAIADAVMSLDNVIAIAAASDGNIKLFIFGLLLSIPLIVFGSTLLDKIMTRFPIIIWAGAALLGWISGEMIIRDPFTIDWLRNLNPSLLVTDSVSNGHGGSVDVINPIHLLLYSAALSGAAIVVLVAKIVTIRRVRKTRRSVVI